MTVFVIDNAPLNIRGELTRWMLETKPGVFVGNISSLVRDLLWKKITDAVPVLDAIMIFSFNNEQGFNMKMTGEPHRSVVDFDGVQLIKIQ